MGGVGGGVLGRTVAVGGGEWRRGRPQAGGVGGVLDGGGEVVVGMVGGGGGTVARGKLMA